MQSTPPVSQVPPYSAFAEFYDEAMGDQSQKIALLEGFILENLPQAKSLLELACGTGTILAGFAKNFEITGLDLSPEMLSMAQQKLPNIPLLQGDMANFELNQTYDIVLCIFNSINHLTSFKQWSSLFKNASKHLNPGGIFIFDINTTERLEALAKMPSWLGEVQSGFASIEMRALKKGYQWHVQIFKHQRDNLYELFEETVPEVSFPVDKVTNELSKFFAIEKTHAITGHEGQDIIYFVCRR